jgi:transcriptional regulator with GAF, ATPase, and Fis domain
MQAADFGVLFLDEAAELDVTVQAKLLRVLETREVVPLGASHGARISTRIVLATHRDLRAAVAEGHFRGDLYHRIAPPEITLPPLRQRLDEIALHVVQALAGAAPSLRAQARFVEACFMRAWPGNVRELRRQVHDSASRALREGALVHAEYLSPTAGQPFRASGTSETLARDGTGQATPTAERRSYVRWSDSMTRERLERALADHDGNVSLAAQSLGMPRSQFYKQMERLGAQRPAEATAAAGVGPGSSPARVRTLS